MFHIKGDAGGKGKLKYLPPTIFWEYFPSQHVSSALFESIAFEGACSGVYVRSSFDRIESLMCGHDL